jgi:hypothetical protein
MLEVSQVAFECEPMGVKWSFLETSGGMVPKEGVSVAEYSSGSRLIADVSSDLLCKAADFLSSNPQTCMN